MKNGKKKALFTMVLAAAMMLSSCCPTIITPDPDESTDTSVGNSTETSTANTSDDAAEITLFWPWGGAANPETKFDSEFSDFLAEKINVRVSLSPCQSDATEVLNLARASKTLPDIVFSGVNLSDAILWYSEGNTISLDKYFDDAENYPNISRMTEGTRSFFENDAGEMVCAPSGAVAADLNAPLSETQLESTTQAYGYFVRKDLYEEYGQELLSVEDVDAFFRWCLGRTAIDGTSVVPLGIPRWASAPNVEWFLAPFGGRTGNSVDADGNIIQMEATEPYYDMLKQMNTWFRDGVISPEVFTDDFSVYESKIAAGKFAMIYGSSWATLSYNANISDENMKYVPIPYWRADGVTDLMANNDVSANPTNLGSGQLVVSSACKDPDAAVRFIDYMTSPEGNISGNAGAVGVGWEWADEENLIYRLLDKGKEISAAGGDPDWITNAGIYGNFAMYQYGMSFDTVELENSVEDPWYVQCRNAWEGEEGHLYGHRMATIDMITATEDAKTLSTTWDNEKGKWMLDVFSASEEDFDTVYREGLLEQAEILGQLEKENEKAWADFKEKHSDLEDDPSWYGPVERVVTFE